MLLKMPGGSNNQEPSRFETGQSGKWLRLLGYVPHVQKSGVAGGRNLPALFPGCTI